MNAMVREVMDKQLIAKYDVPTPRFTSYPTVPAWDSPPSSNEWLKHLRSQLLSRDGQSSPQRNPQFACYVHLPFCETLCTFCGCNKVITKNHDVEGDYIKALQKEWSIYQGAIPEEASFAELHLGGGTPTFFSPKNLESLIRSLFAKFSPHADSSLSFEAHPNVTDSAHLEVLASFGFTRVSFGVQDFDKKVQEAINRRQSIERVEKVTQWARTFGYTSINYDLIYGLPFQTLASLENTLEEVGRLRPDRIAFYSYAHVPWLKPSQRRYTEQDLPQGSEKRALYEQGREFFEAAGYVEIGMDHFALPQDPLAQAFKNQSLHRNFMGYTTHTAKTLIGLGVSAIGDSWTAYAQNSKSLEEYYQKLSAGALPIVGGHVLTENDLRIKQHILNLICFFKTKFSVDDEKDGYKSQTLQRLAGLVEDNLVRLEDNHAVVTEVGKTFVRNICHAFDERYWQSKKQQTFSRSI